MTVPLDEDDQSNSMKKMAKMDPTLLDDTSLTKHVFRYVLLKWIIPFYLKLACCILMLIVFLCHMLNLEAGMLWPDDDSVPLDEDDQSNSMKKMAKMDPTLLDDTSLTKHVFRYVLLKWIIHFYLKLACCILMPIVFLCHMLNLKAGVSLDEDGLSPPR